MLPPTRLLALQSWGRLRSWAQTTLSQLDPCSVVLHLACPSWDPHLGGASHPQMAPRLCEVCSGWNGGDPRWRCGGGHPVHGWDRSGLSLWPPGGLRVVSGQVPGGGLSSRSSPQADRMACPLPSLTPSFRGCRLQTPLSQPTSLSRVLLAFLCPLVTPGPKPSLRGALAACPCVRCQCHRALSSPFPGVFISLSWGTFLLLRAFLHPLCITFLAGASFGSFWPW